MLDMIFRIQTLVLFFTAVSLSQAQYFYPYSRQESAVSLNNAPVGIYGRTSNMYGGSEEYGVSLGGAPVGIYGRRRQMNRSPSYFAPSLWDYWSMMYALECYRNGYLYDFPYATPLPKPVKDSRVPSVSPRGFKGSISVASSSADAVREKTTAEAVSLQGNISPHVILDLLDL